MAKLWAGVTSGNTDKIADDFNSSIRFDSRMFLEDIRGSVAHCEMLAKQGIITVEDAEQIKEGLNGILADLVKGTLQIDPNAEDIHMFVESVLTERIGDVGKRLHTARSRNDQVALDIRMYLQYQIAVVSTLVKQLIEAVLEQAKANTDAICPGYTHLQRAQPISFAHQLLAYCMMLMRDIGRLNDCAKRFNQCPLGSCALAGTTYDIDREFTASELGFDGYTLNSIDGVSDRDFCLEVMSAFSILMMHLSRFSEEIIFWSSWECKFIELDDAYTTGSSIMPQKRNPDMAELVRGKTGRVYGNLMALLTTLKGLPLAYNKDMQEDKEALFDSIDTVKMCLKVFAPMVKTFRVRKDNMYTAAQKGFINATDMADYLVKKGLPFRSAYKLVGQAVAYCMERNTVLDKLGIDELKQFSPLFDTDVYDEISLESCVNKRISAGGTGKASIEKQIAFVNEFLSTVPDVEESFAR